MSRLFDVTLFAGTKCAAASGRKHGAKGVYFPMMFFAPSKCLGFLLHTCVGAIEWLHIPSWGAAGVARWTKTVDVFSQDLLIIPINHDNLHWCLATVDMRSRAISYYDSMRGSGLSGMPSCTNDSCPASSTDHAFASCH